jgi:putative tryptophan/tyrosine transport system substrate-binding protein
MAITIARRQFITLLGGAAAVWPLGARAQQPALPVIGWLNSGSADTYSARLEAFRQGLREAGYVENRNVAIEYRWAEGHNEQLPALAADLVRRQVAVIATNETNVALAAKVATTTIPIVFRIGNDPVQVGLVPSLNRPGANLTGVAALNTELSAKRLELLHELLPAATIMAALINPSGAGAEAVAGGLQAASHKLGVQVHIVHASTERDFEAAFAMLDALRASGLVITGGTLFVGQVEKLAALALRHAVPAIFQVPEFAVAGGLMAYGTSNTNSYRLVGAYVGRILKGEKPADLPVQQATKVELILNLKTVKALGLTVPLSLLTRADEVIE